jgi:hypothetical protein
MTPIRFAALLLLGAPLVLGACDLFGGGDDDEIIRRAFVTRVVIEDFPLTNPDEGNGWDGGDITSNAEADLYFRLLGSTGGEILNGEESNLVTVDGRPGESRYENAGAADLPVSFTVDKFLIDALDRTIVVELKDDDSDVFNPDDVIELSEGFRLESFIPDPLPDNRIVSVPFESADGTLQGRLTVRFSS